MAAPRESDDVRRLSWTASPDSSHLYGWLFVDHRVYGGSWSFLKVKFRDKSGRITGCYAYNVEPGEGQAIADAMAAAAHPGAVLHARLIAKGNRGYPVSG